MSGYRNPHKEDHGEQYESERDEFYADNSVKHKKSQFSGDSLALTSSSETSLKMFSREELFFINENKKSEENDLYVLSKRPLQCPHEDCNRYVSIIDLGAHFQFEHLDVPIKQIEFETRHMASLSLGDIRYGAMKSLMLLKFPQQLKTEMRRKLSNQNLSRLAIVALTSRVAAIQLAKEVEDFPVETDDYTIRKQTNNNNDDDKIIIWLAANMSINFNYTIAVSNLTGNVRMKYYGPILQLGVSAPKLCSIGHCLILSNYHCAGMSEDETKPVNLDIIIHDD